MHAIKGGWAGQPFALAKHDESEGRKSRIRRSKEERKAMVEVFIKKYQDSNNGSFPSLNLTHKKVGGSFYTVREIVRDVIQENRVLGPGKLMLEEQTKSLEETRLDSIAIEELSAVESPLTLSSIEGGFPVNYNQSSNKEMVLVSNEQSTSMNTQVSHNGPGVNGTLVDVSSKSSAEAELIKTELEVSEPKEVDESVKGDSRIPITQVTPLAADVVAEAFSSSPLSGVFNGSVLRSDTWASTDSLEKQVSQIIELESGTGLTDIHGNHSTTSGPEDEKAVKNFEGPLSEGKSLLVEETLVELEESIDESSEGPILKESSKHEAQNPGLEVCADTPISVTFVQVQKSDEMEAANAPSNIKELNETFRSGIDQESKIKETEVENKVDAQQYSGSQQESIPTLNRINLESWEGESQSSSSKPEDNSILSIFKAFVAAFVKFWSE